MKFFNRLRQQSIAKQSAKLKKLKTFRTSIMQDFDETIERLMKKKLEIQKTYSKKLHKDKLLPSLEVKKITLLKQFDIHINKLSTKKSQVQKALNRKIYAKKLKFGLFLRYLVSAPFIYAMIIPAVIMHIFLEVYHQICFPLYGLPKVKAKDYFVFDRRHLPFLTLFEKINCVYCSYFNCLVSYLREVSARTERYWCPIKHANKLKDQHSQYNLFFDPSKPAKYKKGINKIRTIKKTKVPILD
ncbi:hypothetical protein KAI58_01480 [Candidatus Gracilibacteria bacterium]|nr:hypothetical protein [Candidatus Gracilibacteria bacterium]